MHTLKNENNKNESATWTSGQRVVVFDEKRKQQSKLNKSISSSNHSILQRMAVRQNSITHNSCPLVQAKLRIGQPNDKYEQEADRVAELVMRMPELAIQQKPTCASGKPSCREEESIKKRSYALGITPFVQRQAEEEEKEIRTKPFLQHSSGENVAPVSLEPVGTIQWAGNSGQVLPDNVRESMEHMFRADFRDVKIHTDVESDRLNKSLQARAFTAGQNIYFRQGEYSPLCQQGQVLIAHELIHLIQQCQSFQTPNIQCWRWPWSPPPPLAIATTEPEEERELIFPRELEIETFIAEGESRQLSGIIELARLPHRAHSRWQSLNSGQRGAILWEMARRYGPDFARQFRSYAIAGRFDTGVTITNFYRLIEGIQVPLIAGNGRPAVEEGYQFAGAGIDVGLLHDYELWVHSSGRRIEFHPRAREEERGHVGGGSRRTGEEPPREEDLIETWRDIWSDLNEGCSVTVESNERVTHNITRAYRHGDIYYFVLNNLLTVGLDHILRNFDLDSVTVICPRTAGAG